MAVLIRLVLLTGVLSIMSVPVVTAEPMSPKEQFIAGVEAFKKGELERSRELLVAAWNQGVDTTALHYNLAVVHFKLGDHQRAEAHFGRLLDTEHRDLALYNLGLVARADDRESKARAYFRQVAREAGNDALRRRARMRLEARRDEPEDEPLEPSLDGVVSVSGGYEDNISRLPDSGAAMISDSFRAALVAVRGKPLVTGSEGDSDALELSLAAYRRHYHSEPDYRSDFGRVGVAWVNHRGEHQTRVGLKQAYLRFGGTSRQWQSTLEVDYRHGNCLSESSDQCKLSFEGTHVTPYSGFRSRAGERYRFTAGYRQRSNSWERQVRYRGEINNRRDFETDRAFISHSPRRHDLSSGLTYRGFNRVSLGCELQYRYSDYPDDFRLGSTATGKRWDHRYGLELTTEWRLTREFRIKAEAAYTRNDSSLQRFDYTNRRYQLSFRYRL